MAKAFVRELCRIEPTPGQEVTHSTVCFRILYFGLAIGSAEEEVEVVVANSLNKAQQKGAVNSAILSRLLDLSGVAHNTQDVLTMSDLAG